MTPAHDRTERVLALMRGEGRGPKAALSRFGLWLLSRVYAFGIGVYNIKDTGRLQWGIAF